MTALVAYTRVSTADQENGVEAQRNAIERAASGPGWVIYEWCADECSGATVERPGLDRALELVQLGPIAGIVVAKLDRLTRSVLDAATLFKRAASEDWAIISLAPAVDMTTPYGKAMAQMAVVFAELERELIGQRTSEALQAKIARGEPVNGGVKLREAHARIVYLRDRIGLGWHPIQRRLVAEGVLNTKGENFDARNVYRMYHDEKRREA